MVMREIEDPFGLKMDVWADEVIDEAILSRGTVAHNHLVGLTGRYTVFSTRSSVRSVRLQFPDR